jgi:hypothetical protein
MRIDSLSAMGVALLERRILSHEIEGIDYGI